VQIEPDNKDIVYNLGIVYLRLEDNENAKQYFLKAVKLDPKFADAYNNLGVTYIAARAVAGCRRSIPEGTRPICFTDA